VRGGAEGKLRGGEKKNLVLLPYRYKKKGRNTFTHQVYEAHVRGEKKRKGVHIRE